MLKVIQDDVGDDDAIDLFAGAGGFSEGATQAGLKIRMALNHYRPAVDIHETNHPLAKHECQDAQQYDFRLAPRHRWLLGSPACQGHTKARGTEKPHHDAMRATAWAMVTCAEVHKPEFVLVENVEAFTRSRAALTDLRWPSGQASPFSSVVRWDEGPWTPVDPATRLDYKRTVNNRIQPLVPATYRQIENGLARFGERFVIPYYGATRSQAVEAFRAYVLARPELLALAAGLRGKVLGCHCGPREECHGDVWIELAEASGGTPVSVHLLPRYEIPRHDLEDGLRLYETPDGWFPSVTTVLKATADDAKMETLRQWRLRLGDCEADKVMADASRRGNALHLAIENYLSGLPFEITEEIETLWESVREVMDRVTKVYAIEAPVWHPNGYAGTFDFLGELDHRPVAVICDWKNARFRRRAAWIQDYYSQLAAYAPAIEHTYRDYGLRVRDALLVVALPKQPATQIHLTAAGLIPHHQLFRERLRRYNEAMAA